MITGTHAFGPMYPTIPHIVNSVAGSCADGEGLIVSGYQEKTWVGSGWSLWRPTSADDDAVGEDGAPGGGAAPKLVEVFEGFGEEVVDLVVEVVGVFAEGAVAGVGDYPEVCVGDVLVDEDGVGDGD